MPGTRSCSIDAPLVLRWGVRESRVLRHFKWNHDAYVHLLVRSRVGLDNKARPDAYKISGLQQALSMLGKALPSTTTMPPKRSKLSRGFQMHIGIVAYGIAGMQTEAKLLVKLRRSSEFCSKLLSPRQQ
jgi:hypothetical protein